MEKNLTQTCFSLIKGIRCSWQFEKSLGNDDSLNSMWSLNYIASSRCWGRNSYQMIYTQCVKDDDDDDDHDHDANVNTTEDDDDVEAYLKICKIFNQLTNSLIENKLLFSYLINTFV